MAEQWLSIVEYARTFNISDMTIRRRIRTGKLQAHLRDGKYYIPMSAAATLPASKQSPHHQGHSIQKSHPHSERTMQSNSSHSYSSKNENRNDYSARVQSPTPDSRGIKNENRGPYQPARNWEQIPQHLAASISQEPEVSVEANALLDYCNSSLAGIREIERHVEGRYAARLETSYEQIKNRDIEIARLNQQIEDLQLLVQIIEKKRS